MSDGCAHACRRLPHCPHWSNEREEQHARAVLGPEHTQCQWEEGASPRQTREGRVCVGICVRMYSCVCVCVCACVCNCESSVAYISVHSSVYVCLCLSVSTCNYWLRLVRGSHTHRGAHMNTCVCVCEPLTSLSQCDAESEQGPSSEGEERTGLCEVPTSWLRGRLLAPGSAWQVKICRGSQGHVCILDWGSAPKPSTTSGTLGGHCMFMCPQHQKCRP